MFVCLALPGKQYQACDGLSDQGKPCKQGYDSHFGAAGTELVFFSSDQLLPVFIAEAKAIPTAKAAATSAIDAIAQATGNRKPHAPAVPPGGKKRRFAPGAGGGAMGGGWALPAFGGGWGPKPPPLHGKKHIPRGAPNCLADKSFLVSGTLESLDREEVFALIEKYGGSIIKSVPKKKRLDYAVIGEEAGPTKLRLLAEKKIPQIDENGLLAMIRDSLPPDERAEEPEVGELKESHGGTVAAAGLGSMLGGVLSGVSSIPASFHKQLMSFGAGRGRGKGSWAWCSEATRPRHWRVAGRKHQPTLALALLRSCQIDAVDRRSESLGAGAVTLRG